MFHIDLRCLIFPPTADKFWQLSNLIEIQLVIAFAGGHNL